MAAGQYTIEIAVTVETSGIDRGQRAVTSGMDLMKRNVERAIAGAVAGFNQIPSSATRAAGEANTALRASAKADVFSPYEAQARDTFGRFVKQGEQAGKAVREGISNGLKAARNDLKQFGSDLQGAGLSLSAAITAPLVAAGAATIKIGNDYQQSLNLFQAATQATKEQMDAAAAAAKVLGADLTLPATSAGDAAKAMTELAKGGLSAEQAIAAAKGTLQLAAAAGIEEARAAEIATNALNSFNLKASETGRVADLLAAAANASSAEIGDVAASLQQSSAAAAALNIPIESLVSAIGLMANAGIKGSDAGTSLKTAMLALSAPTQEAANEMERLGIAAFTSDGQMRPLRDVIGQFSTAFAGLTQQQRLQAAETIFGADAMRAALIVFGSGADTFDKMQTAVTRSGAAADLAGARTKGLAGAWAGLQSQLETGALVVFERVEPVLTRAVKAAADFTGKAVDMAAAFAKAHPQAATLAVGILAIVAAVGPLLLGLGALAQAVTIAQVGFAALAGVGIGPVLGVLAAVTAAVGLLYLAWKNNFGGIRDITARVMASVTPVIQKALAEIQKFWAEYGEAILKTAQQTWETVRAVVEGAVGAIFNTVAGLIQLLVGDWAGAMKSFGLAAESSTGAVKTLFNSLDGGVKDAIKATIDFLDDAAVKIAEKARNIGQSIKDGLSQAAEAVIPKSALDFLDQVDKKITNAAIATRQATDRAFNFSSASTSGAGQPGTAGAPSLNQLFPRATDFSFGGANSLSRTITDAVEAGLNAIDRNSPGVAKLQRLLGVESAENYVRAIEATSQRLQQKGVNVSASNLANVISFESGHRPNVVNQFGYAGLLQFGAGARSEQGLELSDLLKGGRYGDRIAQLDVAEEYLLKRAKELGSNLGTLEELYGAVLYPKAVKDGRGFDAPIFKPGTTGYRNNPAARPEDGGAITLRSAADSVRRTARGFGEFLPSTGASVDVRQLEDANKAAQTVQRTFRDTVPVVANINAALEPLPLSTEKLATSADLVPPRLEAINAEIERLSPALFKAAQAGETAAESMAAIGRQKIIEDIKELTREGANIGRNIDLKAMRAAVDEVNNIRQADEDAYLAMARSRVRLADATIFHSARANATVMEHLERQTRGITEIVADAQIRGIESAFSLADRGIEKLTRGLGVFKDVVRDVLSGLTRLALNRVFTSLLGGGNGGGGFNLGSAPTGGGGGFNLGGIVSNLLGGGSNFRTPSFVPGGGLNFAGAGASGGSFNGQTLSSAINVAFGGGGRISIPQSISQQSAQQSGIARQIGQLLGIGGGGSNAASGGAQATGGFLSRAIGGLTGGGAVSLLPSLLGAGLGSSLGGQSGIGRILGGIGGAAVGLGTSFGAAVFGAGGGLAAAGLAALGPAAIIGAPLLIGAYLFSRAQQRRKDEEQSGVWLDEAVQNIFKMRDAGKAGTLTDINEARKIFESEILGQFIKLIQTLRTESVRTSRLTNQTRDLRKLFEDHVVPHVKPGAVNAAAGAAFKHTYASGGLVAASPLNGAPPELALSAVDDATSTIVRLSGGERVLSPQEARAIGPAALAVAGVPGFAVGVPQVKVPDARAYQYINQLQKFTGIVPGVFDRRDDKVARVPKGAVVLTPEQQTVLGLRRSASTLPGYATGGQVSGATIPVSFGNQAQQQVVHVTAIVVADQQMAEDLARQGKNAVIAEVRNHVRRTGNKGLAGDVAGTFK